MKPQRLGVMALHILELVVVVTVMVGEENGGTQALVEMMVGAENCSDKVGEVKVMVGACKHKVVVEVAALQVGVLYREVEVGVLYRVAVKVEVGNALEEAVN